jgi:DNA polymerase-3 subunit delta'
MNLEPYNQTKLYGLNNELEYLINLYNSNKLPNKILFSGPKGIGKATLAYHLINYILSIGEKNHYNIGNFTIDNKNRTYKLIQLNINPNFSLIDILPEKKNIDINQIRQLITNMNKTSFNDKPRLILIDNIEFLNINSVNALLKILEEPPENTYFILIHNHKKVLQTLKSRCIEFKIRLTNKESLLIIEKIIEDNIENNINKDLINHYFTPGKIYNLIKFSKENKIELKDMKLKDFISLIIKENYYKKDNTIKFIIYELIEFFLINNLNSKFTNYDRFIKKIDNLKKFNLDQESFFLDFKFSILDE